MCLAKFYRNFILCGEADHHCLLCNETFHKLDDIEKHIRWEKHRKVIKLQTCLPKLKNDGITKIDSYYYCQFCNHVAFNMASVKDHVGSEKHTCNKTTADPKNKRIVASYDTGTVAINELKIKNLQWHCIQSNHCLICNANATNTLKHIETQGHIIRLIQTETKYEGVDKCYRMVNESTFQCFTCMSTFPPEEFDTHWQKHNKNEIGTQIINGTSENPTKIYDREEFNKLGDHKYDIAKLANIEDEFYSIDLKNNEITCKQCKSAVKNTRNSLINHMYIKHKNYNSSKSNILEQIREDIEKEYIFIYERDAGKARHELAVYGKENHIKLNAGGSKGYCTLCDRFLSAHISIFKQHVGGSLHNGHLEFKGQIQGKKHKSGSTKTAPFSRYLFKLEYLTDLDAVAMNMMFCIDRDSFLLMKRIKHGKHYKLTKCFVCDETFKWWEEKKHCETKTHRSQVMSAKVVIEKYNFIREIKPKLYHCGICNVTLPFWDTLEKHIDDLSHKTKVTGKHFSSAMKFFQEQNGSLPEAIKIEHSSNVEVLYDNILKVLYENRLGDLHIFSINLDKLEESGFRGVVLM